MNALVELYKPFEGKDVVVQFMMPWLVTTCDPDGAPRTARDEHNNLAQFPSLSGKLVRVTESGLVMEFREFGGRGDFKGVMAIPMQLVGHLTTFEKVLPILIARP